MCKGKSSRKTRFGKPQQPQSNEILAIASGVVKTLIDRQIANNAKILKVGT